MALEVMMGFTGIFRVYRKYARRCSVSVNRVKLLEGDELELYGEHQPCYVLTKRYGTGTVMDNNGSCRLPGQPFRMLVYEFMGNGTCAINTVNSKRPLDFVMCFRIATGSTRGILYLHDEANPPIFHHDIKASNILLDAKYNARVTYFGLSTLAPLPDLEGSAPGHVSIVDHSARNTYYPYQSAFDYS
eukprot:Gb_28610 [translate_table: standard]